MSHKSKPKPTTSAIMDTRMPVTAHDGKASVGHDIGAKTILAKDNGKNFTGEGGSAAGSGPGSVGNPTTGPAGNGNSSEW